MPKISLKINGQTYQAEVAEGTSLLWVLREHLGLTATKYGCGIAQCGSCTIHVDGQAMRACALKAEDLTTGQEITTLEGLSEDGSHPLQRAWVEVQAPQCGYCQPGQLMQAAALLQQNPRPTREEIKSYMNGVLCRCGTYLRIIKAVERASEIQTNPEA